MFFSRAYLCLAAVAFGGTLAANVSGLVPLSIPPSQYFDGNDGQWSTFFVQVGTPPQAVRVLPGTSASAGDTLWVVLPEGCTDANPGLLGCTDERHVFTRNKSVTWSTNSLANKGLYALNTFEEGGLGLTGNAYYGFDTVELGLTGSGMPTLDAQLIAGIATNDFWLGSLGLSPVPFNFTTLNYPVPSILGNLRSGNTIPSRSWGYTAGAFYQDPPVFGSLTLGGYDTSRFNTSQTLTDIGFGADFSRDLVVELQSITYSSLGSSPLLAGSFFMFIDSMVPHMWLPVEVCQAFESAFNITWNSTLELYLIDDDVHDALLAENPTFTLTLGPGGDRNDTVEITIPYAAFDLDVSQPIVANGSSRYFPLKQAQNSSQYTLGRVFLQEAYVITDYERQNFTLAQALFPSTSVDQALVAILPPDFAITMRASGLSSGAIAGIAIGAAVVVAAIVAMLLWKVCSQRKKKRVAAETFVAAEAARHLDEKQDLLPYQDIKSQPELDGGDSQRHEIDGNVLQPPELDSKSLQPPELDGMDNHRHEIDSVTGQEIKQTSLHEIEGREIAYELEASSLPARR